MRALSRPDLHKTALVLAGGGLTGAMYEIGALRAIDDILTDRSVNDFDIYVGTSAGAIVGALLANGATPETDAAAVWPATCPVSGRSNATICFISICKTSCTWASNYPGR